jgi:hypothetical protein
MIDFPEFEKAEKNRIEQYFKTHKVEDYSQEYKSVEEIKQNWKNILKIWLFDDFNERIKPLVNP